MLRVMTLIDTRKIGAKGGRNSRKYMDADQAMALAQKAANARWEQYYRDHPEKLKARREREARKTGKVRRPLNAKAKK
jgi:hypothetical protein